LILNKDNIVGVINLNNITRGLFQSVYLGFYAVADFSALRGLCAAIFKNKW